MLRGVPQEQGKARGCFFPFFTSRKGVYSCYNTRENRNFKRNDKRNF